MWFSKSKPPVLSCSRYDIFVYFKGNFIFLLYKFNSNPRFLKQSKSNEDWALSLRKRGLIKEGVKWNEKD